jgi:hypothetical protein
LNPPLDFDSADPGGPRKTASLLEGKASEGLRSFSIFPAEGFFGKPAQTNRNRSQCTIVHVDDTLPLNTADINT